MKVRTVTFDVVESLQARIEALEVGIIAVVRNRKNGGFVTATADGHDPLENLMELVADRLEEVT